MIREKSSYRSKKLNNNKKKKRRRRKLSSFYVLLTVHPRTISQIIQLGAQFCAHHQQKVTVSMRHWYFSLWMGGVWSSTRRHLSRV